MSSEVQKASKQELVPITAPTTDPWAKGLATSEGRIALSTVVVSLIVAVFSQAAPLFEQASEFLPAHSWWLHSIATVVGLLAAAGTAIGYGAFRSGVKKIQIASETQQLTAGPGGG